MLQRMILQQQAKRGDLLEILRRNRCYFKAALSFGDDQAFRAHPVQQFAERADAGAIALADLLQPQLLAGRKNAEDDVGADSAINRFPDRLGCRCFR
jgi:hypothetical protein